MSRWRIFCALELPEDVRASAAAHIERLRKALPDVRASWERPEKIHITLKFMGEIEQERVADLTRAADRAASLVQPFDLTIEGTGVFPPRGQPRILWLGVEDSSGRLKQLQQHLEDECAAEGFPKEERPFHPHLTIARLRSPQGARTLASLHKETDFEPARFSISELLIIRSQLGPKGSQYTTLSHHNLNSP